MRIFLLRFSIQAIYPILSVSYSTVKVYNYDICPPNTIFFFSFCDADNQRSNASVAALVHECTARVAVSASVGERRFVVEFYHGYFGG